MSEVFRAAAQPLLDPASRHSTLETTADWPSALRPAPADGQRSTGQQQCRRLGVTTREEMPAGLPSPEDVIVLAARGPG